MKSMILKNQWRWRGHIVRMIYERNNCFMESLQRGNIYGAHLKNGLEMAKRRVGCPLEWS